MNISYSTSLFLSSVSLLSLHLQQTKTRSRISNFMSFSLFSSLFTKTTNNSRQITNTLRHDEKKNFMPPLKFFRLSYFNQKLLSTISIMMSFQSHSMGKSNTDLTLAQNNLWIWQLKGFRGVSFFPFSWIVCCLCEERDDKQLMDLMIVSPI